jgi:quercetin dioxygenase-like cupin family protein
MAETGSQGAAGPLRRLVTGLDAHGRSCIQIDGPAASVIWRAEDLPADNAGAADLGGARMRFPTRGVEFVFADFAPGAVTPMHATDTLDLLVVVSGEVTLVTETGERVLRAGDVLVDRGVAHAWRNHGEATCRIVNVLCPAHPVGAGATMAGEIDA